MGYFRFFLHGIVSMNYLKEVTRIMSQLTYGLFGGGDIESQTLIQFQKSGIDFYDIADEQGTDNGSFSNPSGGMENCESKD